MTDTEQTDDSRTWKNYIPLMVLLALCALGASAVSFYEGADQGISRWMHLFMGFFLINFSMFKLFNIPGFADGFQMYDLLAKRFRLYGFVYPFLELGLGLAYLSQIALVPTYILTIVLMSFGALGVFVALKKKLDINCACMGTVLDVPLSTVAVLEDLGMTAMAIVMLLMR